MFGLFWKKITGLFKKGQERYFVVEQINDRFEATYAKINHKRKKISILKRKKLDSLDKLKKPFWQTDRFILGLDPSSATTIESVVRLKRSRPQEIINEAELDHLIFRGLWEFLNHYRGWAARKMKISDLDLILAGIEIRDVGLGTHRVFNPLGFKGPDFFLRFRGTFVPRSLLEVISPFKKWTEDFMVIELPCVVSASIPEYKDFVVHTADLKTSVFAFKDEENLFFRELPWGFLKVLGSVARHFGTDEETAQLIIGRFLKGEVSERVHRAVESLINREFRVLLDMIGSLYNKSVIREKPTVYFNFLFNLTPPEFLFGSNRMRPVNFKKWLEIQGFSLVCKVRELDNRLLENPLAIVSHPYHYHHYEPLNRLLRRRAKWLVVHQ